MDGWIVVPNWDKFQHYKDRDPIWIRTYTRLLHDDAYRSLTGHQRGVLHGLWLAYATSGCQLRDNTATVTRQLGIRVSRRTLEALSDAGFIHISASKMVRAKQRNSRTAEEGLPNTTAVASYAAPAVAANKRTSKTRELAPDLLEKVAKLGGADRRTTAVLTSFANRGLPEAAFRTALEITAEALADGRVRGNPIEYYVGALRNMETQGQYP